MMSNVSALILSAGFGSRLKPWTDECAKPLIPVAGVEALFYALFRVSKAGIKNVFVNAHYKSEQIEEALEEFKSFFPELKITLSKEEKILGTGGGILKILHEQAIGSGLLTLNGDTLSSLDIRVLPAQGSCFSVSADTNFFKRYNPVYIDSVNRWVGLNKKDGLRAVHILGAHYLSAEDLKIIKQRSTTVKEIDLFAGVYDVLGAQGRPPKAVEFLNSPTKETFWFDLTNKEFLLEAKTQLSGPYFSLWKEVLELRHPQKSKEEALAYWPLMSS